MKEGAARELFTKENKKIVSGQVIFWGEGNGRGLTQITSLVLIRKFQIDCLKVTFLGEVLVSCGGPNNSILGSLFLFPHNKGG